jgi:hypothetical protein
MSDPELVLNGPDSTALTIVLFSVFQVSLTHSTRNLDWKPKNPRNYEEKIELIHEVSLRCSISHKKNLL